MTTRVVKGSFWTLLGLALPIAASFFATPKVIEFLGTESYGVFILVLLIPTYFSFADFGMNIASTKFGSDAHAHDSPEQEARVVRTAALIALLTSFPFAASMFIFAAPIVRLFKVPEHLLAEASLSLRFASIIFILNFLNNIFNTPQLTRLRMDLNMLVTSGARLIAIVAVPVVLYFGGGILGAVLVTLAASMLTLAGHMIVSGRLLKEIFGLSIDPGSMRTMLKFGGSMAIAGIAAVLLVNLEKVILTRATSVETLAHYSISMSFAAMITLFSGSITQSLMPAFSQLQRPELRTALNALYTRGIRINLIWIMPAVVSLSIAAKPFFTAWAGEDFGRESTLPFYIILGGLVFNVVAFFPHAAIIASGRSDIIAKIYWIELLPYILLVILLASRFGAPGAGAAWSIRVIADTIVLFWLAKKVAFVEFKIADARAFLAAATIMIVPIAALVLFGQTNLWVIAAGVICNLVYAVAVWNVVLKKEETSWFKNKIRAFAR